MTLIAVDASVALKLLVPEPHSAEAIALFHDAATARDTIVAPHLLPVELTNILRSRMRRLRLALADALTMLDDFLALPIELVGGPDIHRRALRLTEA